MSALKFPKENHSQFHFQPLSYQETFEVIDEDKVQSPDNDTGPAEPVSASLVEIVEENSPNQVQNNYFKQPLQTKNSLPDSSAIFPFPHHKVHTLQTGHRKTHVKLKHKSARVYPSSSKSKIFTRVSIPGKHRIFNTFHAGTNWTKLLLSPKFTSLKHNTFKESALQLSNNINVTDEAKKRINQMERNQATSRDILEAFISRMGLNVGSDLQPEPSPRVDVPERLSHLRPPKTVLLNKGSTYLPPKKAFTARKPTSSSRNSLQSSTVIKGVPLEKKEQASPLEPEVFNSSPDEIFLNSRKNSTSNSGKNYVNNSPNLRILNSLLRDKDAHFLDNIVTGRDKSGLETHPISQVSPLSPSVNNLQTKGTTQQQKNNKSQDNSRTILIGREKSGLSTRPKSQVSPISTSVNNTQTKGTTPQLKKNRSQDKNGNIVTGRDKSGLETRPSSQLQVLPQSASVNKTKTKAAKPAQLKKKSQDKSKNIVTGFDKSGLGTRSKGQVSLLSPSVNNTERKGTTQQQKDDKSQDKSRNIVIGRDKSGLSTRPKSQVSPIGTSVSSTTTTQQKNNKTQDKSRNIVIGREKSGLGTRPTSKISSLIPSANNIKTNTTTQQKNNKTQDKSGNIVTGRDKSGLVIRPTSKVSSLSTRANNTKTNNATTQQKNDKTQDKSGNIRDYPKIGTNEKHSVNHNNSGSYNLVLAHTRKNTTHLNSTKLSIETTGPFTSSLDSNISLKHFSDLINFFNSFNSSSDKKPTSHFSTEGNSHGNNIFKNGTRNRIVSENLLKFLDFVHTKKTSGNNTSKSLKLGKVHSHSDHNSIAGQIKKQLEMSIYRGWNKASKGRRLGSKKLPASLHPSVKNKLTNLNDTTRLKDNDSFAKSKGDNFELNVLQMMRNVSQKELLKLEGDIVKALSSAKMWNLHQRHENQNPGQQHQSSPDKTKDEQLIDRQHNKQEHISEKQLNYQQLNKQRQMLKHSNSKFGQQHNQTQKKRKGKETKQQIEESNNRTMLHQHELKFESKESHLQQTNHTSQHLKKKNMSHSLESTSIFRNCGLLVSVNTTKNSPNYRCNQTHNKLSPKNNGRKDLFSHSSNNASQAKTGAFVKTVHTLHNVSSLQSPLAHHSSARKITGNNTLPLRAGSGAFVKIPSFNLTKDVDDTKNISVQLDREPAQEPVNTESISEGTTGSGIVELTEFVDQGKLRENVSYRYKFLGVVVIS